MLTHLLEHAENERHLLFGEQINLEIEVGPAIGLLSQAILAGQQEQDR